MKILSLSLLVATTLLTVDVQAQNYSPMQNQINLNAQREMLQLQRDRNFYQQLEASDRSRELRGYGSYDSEADYDRYDDDSHHNWETGEDY